ncbi:MAG: HIT domain-containing protein [Vicinamibacterales bacterium]
MTYVTGASGDKTSDCVFCDAAVQARDGLVLARGAHTFVILNLYPYNNGHLMVVPNRHIASLAALAADEALELLRFVQDAERALVEAYRPDGINVGVNLGRAAGAGIVHHVHVHLVPRWNGDTNFISVVGDTRVLPEDLPSTATRLRPIFERLRTEWPCASS